MGGGEWGVLCMEELTSPSADIMVFILQPCAPAMLCVVWLHEVTTAMNVCSMAPHWYTACNSEMLRVVVELCKKPLCPRLSTLASATEILSPSQAVDLLDHVARATKPS